jgi:hypothetical protein
LISFLVTLPGTIIKLEQHGRTAMPRFPSEHRPRAGRNDKPSRRRITAIAIGAVVVEGAMLWMATSRVGGNVIVRCHDGHLFTTIWIPGGSLKALRFGPWRYQRCPVGNHWSLVTPVRESELTGEERELAHSLKDIRLP